jgi:FKBP12-rapamycin complex-associated protein
MAMFGSDGKEYPFLLKAHEDTRLDERVMQLFSFVNSFVENSTLPLRSKLSITTYKVIPVTTEVGLIGWVPNCTTLFDLLRRYRTKHDIPVECEWNYVSERFPTYVDLRPIDKLRAFDQGLSKTQGTELKSMLFTESADSADWLERRTNYTASLATTSMVGYILGLGDRHLCNIMMNNRTAKLVHIDFGDCFEVAQTRDKFPEKVPFRLTRLLVKALEIGGINSTFRSSSQNMMALLRANSDQIVGLLSVFTYDPLKQWSNVEVELVEAEKKTEAVQIMKRITDKLDGNDFEGAAELSVEDQVDRLIDQATSRRNLCEMFRGWYAWW